MEHHMKNDLRYLTVGLLTMTSMITSISAQAADLPIKSMPAPVAAAVYNWTGFYVGLNGGYGWGTQDPVELLGGNRFDRTSRSLSGGVFGGTMGAQIQQGNVVLGVEGDLDWADIHGSGVVVPAVAGVALPLTLNVTTKTDALGTARMRFGLAMNNWLFYGTAGAAFLHETASGSSIAGVPCGTLGVLTNCAGSFWRPGLAAGLGTEWAFAPNWTVKAEYIYIVAMGTGLSKNDLNLVRGGINYKF
jgi:outer membrane immunogenic protein